MLGILNLVIIVLTGVYLLVIAVQFIRKKHASKKASVIRIMFDTTLWVANFIYLVFSIIHGLPFTPSVCCAITWPIAIICEWYLINNSKR